MRTRYKKKGHEIGTQKKTVTFEDADQELTEVKSSNPEQENWFGESDVKESGFVDGQFQADNFCPVSLNG